MIDLFNPNRDELLNKWRLIIDQTRRIFTWTTDVELAWIAEYATRCKWYLEIGSYVGRSAKVAFLANPGLQMVMVDTWDDEGTVEDFRHNLRNEAGKFDVFRGVSQEVILSDFFIKSLMGRHPAQNVFDGCWIDGGHLTHLVEADIKNVLPLMASGSLMAGHDYRCDNDVAKGVKAALGNNFYNPIDSIWCYKVP